MTFAIRAVVAVSVALTILSGWWFTRDVPDTITATTWFADVADLAVGAPVQMADVAVGRVASISLDRTERRTEARVVLEVRVDAQVPADVTTRLRRTSVLGEKVVELVPPSGFGGERPLLTDGADIARGTIASDVEDLVAVGAEFFAALAQSSLAELLHEGATALGGQGPELRAWLNELSSVMAGYAESRDRIASVIHDLDQFSASTSKAADQHARLVTNLADTATLLAEESEALIHSLKALADVSVSGKALLDSQHDVLHDYLVGLAEVLQILADEQESLDKVLAFTPEHNFVVSQVAVNNMIQLLIDVKLCGVPGGGEDPDDPAAVCDDRFVEER